MKPPSEANEEQKHQKLNSVRSRRSEVSSGGHKNNRKRSGGYGIFSNIGGSEMAESNKNCSKNHYQSRICSLKRGESIEDDDSSEELSQYYSDLDN